MHAALDEDLILLMVPGREKAFLIQKIISENAVRLWDGKKFALLLLPPASEDSPEDKDSKKRLWREYLVRMLNVDVFILPEEEKETLECHDGGVIVSDTISFGQFIDQSDCVMSRITLVLVDNAQIHIDCPFMASLVKQMSGKGCRWVSVTDDLQCFDRGFDSPSSVDRVLRSLAETFPGRLEASCELTALTYYAATPTFVVTDYGEGREQEALALQEVPAKNPVDVGLSKTCPALPEHAESPGCDSGDMVVQDGEGSQSDQERSPMISAKELTSQLVTVVSKCRAFLLSHVYSLCDTYGEEFADLIADIPDPKDMPLSLLERFESVLISLGPYAAERAALLLLIQAERLKTREKYERHFLLYSLVYTAMVQVRLKRS